MLGAAEADALGSELPRLGGILGRVGVRPHPQPAQLVGPVEDRAEVLVDRGRHEPDGADDHASGAAVDRDHVADVQRVLADRHRAGARVDRETLAARHARLPHAPRNDRGVGGHPTVGGEDAARLDEAVDVVRRRLPAHQDHVVARLAAQLGRVGVEHDLAGSGARRRVQPLGRHLHRRARVDHRVQELVELTRVDACHRLLARDQPLLGHLDRDPQGRGRGALAGARLQEVERPLLDRELDVLHVAVVGLEPVERRRQLRVGLRQLVAHRRDRLRRPGARDDVLALRVDEELPVQDRLAGRRIAGEAHARAGALALVAEHHLHDVHRGADVVGNLVGAPVDLRAGRVPRVEHGPVGAAQLLARILGEARPDLFLVDALERRDQLAQILGTELEVVRHAACSLQIRDRALEALPVDAVHDLAVHLDQAPVRVVGEPRVAGRGRLPLDGDVVQAEVEDRVHHPGHRDRGARPHRHQQRIGRVAEALPRPFLERGDVGAHLVVEPFGHLLAGGDVGAAGIGRDRETGGNRNAQGRHLGQADALPAEELAAPGGLAR